MAAHAGAPAQRRHRVGPRAEGALPLLIVDGRTFTWDQIGRMMMTFEGSTLNAIVEDTIEVVGTVLCSGTSRRKWLNVGAPVTTRAG